MQTIDSSSLSDYIRVKCVLVGDGAVGKTSLIISYTTNGFPTEYVPTAYDNYTVLVNVNNEPVRLQLCDTAGQDDFDLLRPLCYPNTDVFIICFSIVSPTSFHNVTEKWLPEVRSSAVKTPLVLVGTQSDLRNDVKVLIELSEYNEKPISEAEGKATARRIGAQSYIECSALTQQNLKEVFDIAVMAALVQQHGKKKRTRYHSNTTTRNSLVTSAVPQLHTNCNLQSSDESRRHSWKKSFCCWT